MRLAVEFEHGVAAQHEGVGRQVLARRHGATLQLGQLEGQLCGWQVCELRLVDPADDHGRLDAGASEGGKPGG